jgi:biotin carboxyl carrier protein
MRRYDLVINGTPYAVEILTVSGTQATVRVNGVTYQVTVPQGVAAGAEFPSAASGSKAVPASEPRAQPGPSPAEKGAAVTPGPLREGGEAVRAPMPGHIIDVLVQEGDSVKWGDTVVLMEAMKMENEIKAHAAGTVLKVCVVKGQDVSVNDPLVVIG